MEPLKDSNLVPEVYLFEDGFEQEVGIDTGSPTRLGHD